MWSDVTLIDDITDELITDMKSDTRDTRVYKSLLFFLYCYYCILLDKKGNWFTCVKLIIIGSNIDLLWSSRVASNSRNYLWSISCWSDMLWSSITQHIIQNTSCYWSDTLIQLNAMSRSVFSLCCCKHVLFELTPKSSAIRCNAWWDSSR